MEKIEPEIGRIIYKEGDPIKFIYFLMNGVIEISKVYS